MEDKEKQSNDVPNLPIFMSIGLSVGVAIGAAAGNISVGMCIGLCIGVCIGTALDIQKKKRNSQKEETDTKENLQ